MYLVVNKCEGLFKYFNPGHCYSRIDRPILALYCMILSGLFTAYYGKEKRMFSIQILH